MSAQKPRLRNEAPSLPGRLRACLILGLFLTLSCGAAEHSAQTLFDAGVTGYRAADYAASADLFRQAARARLSSGALRNLGNAEWQRGKTGPAILAWEQAMWIDPFDRTAKNNLEFARKTVQIDAPDLDWFEAASSWLPATWWAWVAGLSLWTAIGAMVFPGVLRVRKAAWHQAVAAIGLAVFLLSLPAHIGIATRSRLAFILERNTPLRLTPTTEAQAITRLAAGEPVRLKSRKGEFLFVRTANSRGWVHAKALGALCKDPPGVAPEPQPRTE